MEYGDIEQQSAVWTLDNPIDMRRVCLSALDKLDQQALPAAEGRVDRAAAYLARLSMNLPKAPGALRFSDVRDIVGIAITNGDNHTIIDEQLAAVDAVNAALPTIYEEMINQ